MSNTDRFSMLNIYFDSDESDEESIIESNPCAKDVLDKMQALTKKWVIRWLTVMLDIDSDEAHIEQNLQTLTKSIKNTYKDLLNKNLIIHEVYTDKIAKYTEEIKFFERRLNLEASTTVDSENLCLVERVKILKSKISEYENTLTRQEAAIQNLNQKHENLSKKLGVDPKRLSLTFDQTKVENYQEQVHKLEVEFSDREKRAAATKTNIQKIYDETEIFPTKNFMEVNKISVVTDDAMRKIDECFEEAVALRNELCEEINGLKQKIEKLWDLLNVSLQEREAFINNTKGITKYSETKLKVEIKRLERLKKIKLAEIIEQQKKKLSCFWDWCHVDQTTRNEFVPIYTNDYDERIYELFEREIEKWQLYYEGHMDILDKIEKYKDLHDKLLELELNSGDTKLRKNRGAVLLPLLKQRTILEKRLKLVEKNLLQTSENYLKKQGKPFLVYGETIEKYIAKQNKTKAQNTSKMTLQSSKTRLGSTTSSTSSSSRSGRPKVRPQKGDQSRSKKGTPNLPTFKISQKRVQNSPMNMTGWHPSKLRFPRSPSWSSASEYEQFEAEVIKHAPTSSAMD